MFERNERLNELLLRELSELLRSVKDPGLSGLVTLTGLELAKDRRSARVFYSVLGGEHERESTSRALSRAADFLRMRLKERVSLRSLPQLSFAYDPTPERADRIERLLSRIEGERGDP